MYLDNREILREIHLSKISYCWFLKPCYSHIDDVVDDLSEVDPSKIQRRQPLGPWLRPPERVVRLRTWEHIPPEYIDQSRGRPILRHLKFTPFKHYAVYRDGRMVEVGRSHWIGTPENGHFCCTHGSLTPRLVQMLRHLVANYARRANWRNYSWIDEMRDEALANLIEAALKFDEGKSYNPFGYYTRIAQNAFRGVLAREEKQLDIRDRIMEENGLSPRFDTQVARELEGRETAYDPGRRIPITDDVLKEIGDI